MLILVIGNGWYYVKGNLRQAEMLSHEQNIRDFAEIHTLSMNCPPLLSIV